MKLFPRRFVFILAMVIIFSVCFFSVIRDQTKEEAEVHSINKYMKGDLSREVPLAPCNAEVYDGAGVKGETVPIQGRLRDDERIGIPGKSIEIYWKKTKFAPLGTAIATPITDENGDFSYSDFQVPKTQGVGEAYVVGIFKGDETYDYSESEDVLFPISAYVTVLIDPSIPNGEEYNSTDIITVSGEVVEMFDDTKTSPPRYVKAVEVSAYLEWDHGSQLLYQDLTDDFGQYSISKSIPKLIAPQEYRIQMRFEETEKYMSKPEFLEYREIIINDESFVDTSPPVPVIIADKTSIPSGEIVNFTASNSTENVEITEYEWTFIYDGELKIFTNEDFSFVFVLPGEYEITLKLSDAEGNVGTALKTIIVSDDIPPTAMGRVPEYAYQGDEVELDATDSRDNVEITNYSWSFSYNNSFVWLYEEKSYFIFDIPGEYNITLFVEDDSMNKHRHYFIIEIKDNIPPIPSAMIPKTVNQGEEVLLDASVAKDNTDITNYTWSFAYNGSTVMLYEKKSVFNFDLCGEYNIILTVTDLWDNNAEKTYSITVRDAIKPTANFTGKFHNIKAGQRIGFDGTGSTDNVGIVEWIWNIDGPTGYVTLDEDEIYYSFKKKGSYTIILTVRDAANNQDSMDKIVTVKSREDQDTSGNFSGLSYAVLFIILGIILVIVISVIVIIIILRRKRKQEESKEIDLKIHEDRIIPEQQNVAPVTEETRTVAEQQNVAPVKDEKRMVTEQHKVTPGIDEVKAKNPICPGCGLDSEYYPEYNCYWCEPCQNYVYPPEKPVMSAERSEVAGQENMTKRQTQPVQTKEEIIQDKHISPKTEVISDEKAAPIKRNVENTNADVTTPGIETPMEEKSERIVRKVVSKKVKSPSTVSPKDSSLDGWDL